MPLVNDILAPATDISWPTTSGSVTAVVVVLSLVLTLICAVSLYFLRRHATEYAKGSARGRLQYFLSVLYILLLYSSILAGSIIAWLLAQYDHEDRFPTVGSRDGLRIALFSSCWTFVWSGVHIFLQLRQPQWMRKNMIISLIMQGIWTMLTWSVWVAATATMTRVLPLLTPDANCAGADYCKQLKATLRIAILEILLLSIGVLYLGWASWSAFRSQSSRY